MVLLDEFEFEARVQRCVKRCSNANQLLTPCLTIWRIDTTIPILSSFPCSQVRQISQDMRRKTRTLGCSYEYGLVRLLFSLITSIGMRFRSIRPLQEPVKTAKALSFREALNK